MLSVIKDRIDNADVYEREYFSKYPNYGYSRRKIGFNFISPRLSHFIMRVIITEKTIAVDSI